MHSPEKRQEGIAGIEAYPDLANLVGYCRKIAGGREMPHRKDFRASQARGLYGHMYLVDVLDDGADYRCRLWGQFWEVIFGFNLLDKRLSEVERGGNLAHLRAEYDAMVMDHRIRFRAGRIRWLDGASIDYARVIVPFFGDDGQVSMLLGAGTCGKSVDDLLFFKGRGMPSFDYEDNG